MAPWSRGSRRSELPRTPEPSAEVDIQPPSPPRPRFRLKRRNASSLNAPTQHFLASVAAADIPIPSIEEPRVVDDDEMADSIYPVIPQLSDIDNLDFTHHASRESIFSPPKTPAPGVVPSLSPKRYPDWTVESPFSSLESSPEYESSRPSTARSTQTTSSVFSYFSMDSEGVSQCLSPEEEQADQFGGLLFVEEGDKTVKPKAKASAMQRANPRKAPWTQPMNHHLWTTYMMYLQDPKVTPFRLGKSGIPPHGVCLRVAREARRSWKGSKSNSKAAIGSGSATPTAQNAGAFVQWPHTCAATRAHLRELCKASARSKTRSSKPLGPSPTPYGKTAVRARNRRSVPARSPSIFSGQDMAMSLAVSTSESMQPTGPLAQLTSSQSEPESEELLPQTSQPKLPAFGLESLECGSQRLGSPFIAQSHSYGPSTSNSFPCLATSPEVQRASHTMGSRRSLQSPVRLTRSRSNTQKRRSRRQTLEPSKTKRPSLGSDFWTEPPTNSEGPSTVPRLPQFSSSTENQRDNLNIPRKNLQELFEASRPQEQSQQTLAPAVDAPLRLGSPFALMNSSFSFPNRFSHASDMDMGTIRRPFATVQQPSEHGRDRNRDRDSENPRASRSAHAPRSSLSSRLAYIDERLKDLRRRDHTRRRSESPL